MRLKIFIDWVYGEGFTSPSKLWEYSSLNDCDIILTIDLLTKYDRNVLKILWLMEPRSISDVNVVRRNEISPYDDDDGLYDYVATHSRNLLFKNSKMIYVDSPTPSWVDDQKIFSKIKNISMICSNKSMCAEHMYRLDIRKKLIETIDIDVYGVGFVEISSKNYGLNDYRFSVAMENDNTYGYYSEKLLDCFLTGTIPIYQGGEYAYEIFDKNGIISLDYFLKNINEFDYQFEYNSRFDAIKSNFEIAKYKNKVFCEQLDFIVEKILIDNRIKVDRA